MEVSESHVGEVSRKRLCGYCVSEDMGGAFASGDRRAMDGHVPDDQIDRVRGHRATQRFDDGVESRCVGHGVLVGFLCHQLVCANDPPLAREWEESDLDTGNRLHHSPVCRSGERRTHGDSPQFQEGCNSPQPPRVVVIAGDHDDRGHVRQLEQGPIHDRLRLRSGCSGIEQVTRHDHEVDRLVGGDRGDLGENRSMFVGPAAAANGPSDVPVAGVEQLHPAIVPSTSDISGDSVFMVTRLLFTDLDGTLLDHESYQPGPAADIVRDLNRRHVKIVFSSSKTRSEQEHLAQELGIAPMMIVENGAAVIEENQITELGIPRTDIRRALHASAAECGATVLGYADVPPTEVGEWTGLEGENLERALDRQWSETFVVAEGDPERVQSGLRSRGIRMSRGGRFWTAHGPHDKGTAVAEVLSHHPAAESAALGDAPNDEPMLRAVDRAFQVRNAAGEWALLDVDGLTRVEGVGPYGFVEAVELLDW